MSQTRTSDDEQPKTVTLDVQIALDALVDAWKESDGNANVLALTEDELNDGCRLTWDVRDHSRDEDCIHATNVFDYYHIEDGEVLEYDIPETLTFGDEEFDVRAW